MAHCDPSSRSWNATLLCRAEEPSRGGAPAHMPRLGVDGVSNTVHPLGPWEPSDRVPTVWIWQSSDWTRSSSRSGRQELEGGGLKPSAQVVRFARAWRSGGGPWRRLCSRTPEPLPPPSPIAVRSGGAVKRLAVSGGKGNRRCGQWARGTRPANGARAPPAPPAERRRRRRQGRRDASSVGSRRAREVVARSVLRTYVPVRSTWGPRTYDNVNGCGAASMHQERRARLGSSRRQVSSSAMTMTSSAAAACISYSRFIVR